MFHIFPALMFFLLAVTLDSLTAGLTYGTRRVHIKTISYIILICVPALFITAANRIGSLLACLLPPGALPWISFTLLLVLGMSKLAESLIRYLAGKHPSLSRNWGCKIKQINIIFTIYLSPEDANQEDLQTLSAKEALLLSLALSLDSILVGMAFTAEPVSWVLLFFLAVLFNLFFFLLGYFLGHFLCHLFHVDLSWLSGLFLLLLALHALA
ncbi:MAG: manganese efflux pump [Lachnospiraceae bacterium]|nr:manganese efflux pump [Lachnospiraceae bacterium]